MSVKVTIKDPSSISKRIFDDATMKYANTRLHALCAPYVPMDSGALQQNVDITPEYVHYKVPYAHYQWEGKVYGPNIPITVGGKIVGWYSPKDEQKKPTGRELNHSKSKNPLATAHWERAMAVAKGQQLANEITEYLKKK